MSNVCYRTDKKGGKPWIVQWYETVINPEGKQIRVRKTASFRTKEQAEEKGRKVDDAQASRRHGISNPSDETLFVDFARGWLKRRLKQPDYAYSSWDADERRLRRYWLAKFGPWTLESITSADILEHLDWIQFECNQSMATRNRHRSLIHKLMNDAVALGKIRFNSASAVPLLKNEVRTKKRINLKSETEFEEWLSALENEGRVYWILGNIMGFTGVRICTANALQWQDIHDKVVLFRRIEQRAGGSKIVERIKGKKQTIDDEDAHVVPLLPRLRIVLAQWRKISIYTKPTDFVAANPKTGSYVRYDAWKVVNTRAAKAADVPGVTAHSIRRYYATELKKAGFTRAEIREMGGWSSEQMVARYDIKDVQHLADRAEELGFGKEVGKKRDKN